jgi:predicted ATPase
VDRVRCYMSDDACSVAVRWDGHDEEPDFRIAFDFLDSQGAHVLEGPLLVAKSSLASRLSDRAQLRISAGHLGVTAVMSARSSLRICSHLYSRWRCKGILTSGSPVCPSSRTGSRQPHHRRDSAWAPAHEARPGEREGLRRSRSRSGRAERGDDFGAGSGLAVRLDVGARELDSSRSWRRYRPDEGPRERVKGMRLARSSAWDGDIGGCSRYVPTMSLPTALLVARYRSFAVDAMLPLRPLTLLFGRNSAGKSALTRAFSLLGTAGLEEGIREAQNALRVPSAMLRGGKFQELAWQGDAGDYSFDIGLQWGDGELRKAYYKLNGISERAPYVKELRLLGEKDRVLWEGTAPPNKPMRSLSGQGDDVRFAGLLPRNAKLPVLKELSVRMESLRGRVQWLDGVRKRPEREVDRMGTVPSTLDSDGSNAASFIVENRQVARHVARFYAALNPPRELYVEPVLDTKYNIHLNPMNGESFRINLVDTGEGMVQVLPVLVAAALAATVTADELPWLLALEEPESHLHPDAQYVLARHLCEIASSASPPVLILETHSRVFLLGVQLAVAEGRLPADKVALAWVDQDEAGRSTVTPVELSSSGHPSAGWPVAALNEDLRVASELARLDLKREGA